jgi:Beta-lactamase enzyme family
MRARTATHRRLCAGLALVVLAWSASANASATAAESQTLLSAVTPASEVSIGTPLSLSGILSEAGHALAGVPLAVQADEFPFHGFVTIAHISTAADGSYTFTGPPADRNVRLRVVSEAPGSSVSGATVAVFVEPLATLHARSLGPGRAQLTLRLRHTIHGGASGSGTANWFVAAPHTHVFRLLATTNTRELAPGLSYASAIINPPAKRFLYRVCLNPGWERAMGPSTAHGRCPHHDYAIAHTAAFVYGGEGHGVPQPAYPSAGAIAAAQRYLAGRAGRTSFAVIDSTGQLGGLHLRERFETASVVKVMMLTAFLQMRSAEHRGLSGADMSLLYPMIHISDNNAASAVFSIVGSAAVTRVAHEAGMRDYAPGVGWWAYTQTSAADQARFFFMLDRLIPRQFYAYARGLLAGIEPSQSWGVPPVARPRWQVFFKTGALPSRGLFNEVARLERPGVTFTIAVFTDGDPSMGYGEETIAGIAATLLAHSP